MFYLKLTNIKKNIGQAILVGKCCHCRINHVRWQWYHVRWQEYHVRWQGHHVRWNRYHNRV